MNAFLLRRQSLDDPPVLALHEERFSSPSFLLGLPLGLLPPPEPKPVVDPGGATLPELEAVGDDPEAAPVVRLDDTLGGVLLALGSEELPLQLLFLLVQDAAVSGKTFLKSI